MAKIVSACSESLQGFSRYSGINKQMDLTFYSFLMWVCKVTEWVDPSPTSHSWGCRVSDWSPISHIPYSCTHMNETGLFMGLRQPRGFITKSRNTLIRPLDVPLNEIHTFLFMNYLITSKISFRASVVGSPTNPPWAPGSDKIRGQGYTKFLKRNEPHIWFALFY